MIAIKYFLATLPILATKIAITRYVENMYREKTIKWNCILGYG